MYQYLVLLIAVIIYYLYAPYFQTIQPKEYSSVLPIRFEGPMAENNKLDNYERLHEKEIHWPESMTVYDGKIYTGLGDGRIVSISDKGVQNVTRTGSECSGQHEEHLCGRPLAMHADKQGKLYVVDAYHGLFVIDIKSAQKTKLLPSSKVIDFSPLTFMNGLALDEINQVLYITQSSTKRNISNVIISVVEHDETGRLLKYDIKQKIVTVLKKNLAFPNGVVLSHDGKSLLIAEMNKHTVFKYTIKGENQGETTELPLVLPGEPDNISRSKTGNYWVAVGNSRTADNPTLLDRAAHYPSLRKGFLVIHHMIFAPIASLLSYAGSPAAKDISFELVTLRMMPEFVGTSSVLVEFDESGSVVRSLHAPNSKLSFISEVLEHEGYLYLGSWKNRFLGRVKL